MCPTFPEATPKFGLCLFYMYIRHIPHIHLSCQIYLSPFSKCPPLYPVEMHGFLLFPPFFPEPASSDWARQLPSSSLLILASTQSMSSCCLPCKHSALANQAGREVFSRELCNLALFVCTGVWRISLQIKEIALQGLSTGWILPLRLPVTDFCIRKDSSLFLE